MADDFALSDDEKQAILDHRKATRPQRKGTARVADPDMPGVEFDVELTAEEAEKVIERAAAKLFGTEPKDGGQGGDDSKKPTALKNYFTSAKKASGS